MLSLNNLKENFKNFFSSLNYSYYPSFPLLTNDKTLLFTNSSMVPFKQKMIEGKEIPPIAISQNCFRSNHDPNSFFYFNMLGLISDMSYFEILSSDILKFVQTLSELESINIHIVINKRDNELLEFSEKFFPEYKIHHMEGNNDKYWTRWNFGAYVPLKGIGLTFVYEVSNLPCSKNCNVQCSCNHFFPLGNIIIIHNEINNKKYVDIGFGTETLIAANLKGDYFAIPEYLNLITRINSVIKDNTTSKYLLNYYISFSSLYHENILPGKKKENYISRKMVREFICLLIESNGSLDKVEIYLNKIIPILKESNRNILLLAHDDAIHPFYSESINYLLYLRKILTNLKTNGKLNKINNSEENRIFRESYGLPKIFIS
jgi:alanyl-tRNA synthetase